MERISTFLHRIPGYTGYRDKENRRDEDKRIREAVAAEVSAQVDRLNQYTAELSAEREFTHLSRIEPLIGQARLLGDRIRTASYGYGGIFTERDVDATALDQLRQFDMSMEREVDGLSQAVQSLTATMPPDADAVRGLNDEINRLGRLFDARTTVIDEGKPTRDDQVLALLEVTEEKKPSPLLSVTRNETLSVLGDNYIANATMRLSTDEGTIHLVRVTEDQDNATWLMGSDIAGVPSARLTESASDAPGYQTMSRASAVVDAESGKQEGIAARYALRSGADANVDLTIMIGDSARSYRGNEISDMDIEVYGAAQ
jgi:hypothetical protein